MLEGVVPAPPPAAFLSVAALVTGDGTDPVWKGIWALWGALDSLAMVGVAVLAVVFADHVPRSVRERRWGARRDH